MNKRTSTITSLTLLAALLVSLLASCGESQDIGGKVTQTTAVGTEPAAEEAKYVPDSLPDDLDLEGRSFHILVGDYNNAYYDDLYSAEETGNRLSDTIYRSVRKVQDRLNVKLEYEQQTYAYGQQSTDHINRVVNGIMAGDDNFDLTLTNQMYTDLMVENKLFMNLADMKYVDLTKPWYNQSVLNNIATDYIHFIIGQFSLANVKNAFAIYANLDLYQSLGKKENLYELVDTGKWTKDKLREIVADSYTDLNGNTERDENDRYGLTFGDTNKYLGFLKAFNIDIFTKGTDGFVFRYDSERAMDAIAFLCQLVNEDKNVLPGNGNAAGFKIDAGGGNYTSKLFLEGRSLLTSSLLADAATIVPNIDFDFAVLPYPKWDEESDYTGMLQRTGSALIPVTVSDADASGAVLEALSSEFYRTVVPEYCEVNLKVRYSQNDDISRMFDLIIGNIEYDPGEIYYKLLGSPSATFKSNIDKNDSNWASTMAEKKETLISKMNTLFE